MQYHPEAAAGPHDANYLFDRFTELVRATLTNRVPNFTASDAPERPIPGHETESSGHEENNH